ncbi:MAG: DUF2530 domain-containing protein [Micrococcales bacterium]|nr:DUF2530 domain-containing protein [Micrococcales bacterium]
MRLWLKDSERKPDPTPVATDDRKVVLVGLILWVLTLVGLLIFLKPLLAGGHGFWLWTVVVGIALGIAGLIYTSVRQTRRGQDR